MLALRQSAGLGAIQSSAAFVLEFRDVGSGAVDTNVTYGYGVPTFTRATTATTVLSTGLIGSVASGTARSYYDPATLVYQGYLAEGARTNLCLRSEDFTLAWAAVGTPTNSGTTTCGIVTLQQIGDDSAAALEGYTQTITFTADATKSISILVSQGTSTSSIIRLRDTTAPADRLLAAVTWSGAVPVVTMTTGTDLTGTPQQYGTSGVYRLSFLTTSVTAANTNSLQVYPATDAALEVSNTGTIYAGGVQAEDAVFTSSYIPTAAATVARNADALTYPITGWYNAVEGTLFAEATTNGNATALTLNQTTVQLDDGTVNERILLYRPLSTSNCGFAVLDGGAAQAAIAQAGWGANTTSKLAAVYKANDFALSANGLAVSTDVAGTLPTVTLLRIGSSVGADSMFSPIRRVAYFNTRLANATQQAMAA